MTSQVTGPIVIKRRAAGGAPGAPSSLLSGELAFNFADGFGYIGFGDNGSGVATSIVPIFGYQKYLELLGDQTVNGVKTFTSSPIAPNPALNDNTQKVATTEWVNSTISGFGAGDMSKLIYDTDNDGKVDSAELADNVEWSGILNKPATYTPSAHDANLITTGTIDPARLPAAVFQAPVVSSGDISALTTSQQTAISEGSTITTTDGRMWQYSGSGSKTAEASYVELADVTPAWSAIADKPTTRAGYGITDVQPLDDTLTSFAGLVSSADKVPYFTDVDVLSTFTVTSFSRTLLDDVSASAWRVTLGLGTLATQAASNVLITGGSLTNVTISDAIWDGGTF